MSLFFAAISVAACIVAGKWAIDAQGNRGSAELIASEAAHSARCAGIEAGHCSKFAALAHTRGRVPR